MERAKSIACALLLSAVMGIAFAGIGGMRQGWAYGSVVQAQAKWGPWGPEMSMEVHLGWWNRSDRTRPGSAACLLLDAILHTC